jgi:hypothetical protein
MAAMRTLGSLPSLYDRLLLLALLTARATEDPATDFEHALRRLAGSRDLDDRAPPLLGDDDGGQLFPIANRPPWDCRDTLAAASIALQDRSLALDDAPEEVHWICGGLPTDSIGSPGPLPRPSTALAESGYYVSRSSTGDHLVFDAGRHGFLNGGHAHADALSITLTVQGQPLLIDPGTGTYTMNSALRDLMRSTAMHNTVVVNGQPQARPRGAFHWHHATDARSTLWHGDAVRLCGRPPRRLRSDRALARGPRDSRVRLADHRSSAGIG